ncbi:MAG: anaerobic ribonucleoside-triphosphate reductase activating protein [Anaerostipes sp.]|nr:anaerobic ribonucleoside-triphosphate reductase activating protein [Anaerostipes sp.]
MHVGQILKADCANGTGIRLSVFVSGCTNQCKGCFQQETWDFEYGKLYDEAMESFIVEELKKPFYDGITILGGEPFEMSNQKELVKLISKIKKILPEKNIWMFTGFTYEKDLTKGGCRYSEVTDHILDQIDILVDGRYEEEQKNIRLNFRGSENQRIIDMKKTREGGETVLSPLNN